MDVSESLRSRDHLVPNHNTKMLSIGGQSVLRQARTRLSLAPSLHNTQTLSALARLLSSLALLEQKDGRLIHGSSSAVTAAKQLGGSVTGFVAGSNAKSLAEQAAKIAGIDKVIAVENGAYDKVCGDRPSMTRTLPLLTRGCITGLTGELCATPR
jgi:hypothetical protein